jgi:hypothetical protein
LEQEVSEVFAKVGLCMFNLAKLRFGSAKMERTVGRRASIVLRHFRNPVKV